MSHADRIPGYSDADMAAIDAIAAANTVTNQALQELARAMLDSPGRRSRGSHEAID
jgi:hypothetical protein